MKASDKEMNLVLDPETIARREKWFAHGDYARIRDMANKAEGTTKYDSGYVRDCFDKGFGKPALVKAANEFYAIKERAQLQAVEV